MSNIKAKSNLSSSDDSSSIVSSRMDRVKLIMNKMKSRHAVWKKEELYDAIFWIRHLIALVIGIVWGLIPLKGLVAILGFFGINLTLVKWYCGKYLGIDEEEYGGLGELMKEGLMSSFAIFIISWILVFTYFHN